MVEGGWQVGGLEGCVAGCLALEGRAGGEVARPVVVGVVRERKDITHTNLREGGGYGVMWGEGG